MWGVCRSEQNRQYLWFHFSRGRGTLHKKQHTKKQKTGVSITSEVAISTMEQIMGIEKTRRGWREGIA